MDHSCDKCGHSIEEGRPFCSYCRAPQIRVTIPQTAAVANLAGDVMASERDGVAEPVLPSPLPASSSGDLRSCTLAAGIAVLLTFLGLNPFVAALGSGLLAVAFSRRGAGLVTRRATGARLGAISGLLLFGISIIFETLAVVAFHKGDELRNAMMEKVQQAAARYPGPEVQPFLDFVKSPQGFTFMMVASLVFGLAAFVLLGGIGGAIGTVFLRWRNRP